MRLRVAVVWRALPGLCCPRHVDPAPCRKGIQQLSLSRGQFLSALQQLRQNLLRH
jgi:hypothetical protein